MKILLMLPINRSYVVMPSLGLGYVASVSRAAGHNVKMLHCLKEKYDFDMFERYVKENEFDVVGIQMFTFDVTPVLRHIDIIKRIRPHAVVVLGGYHPSGVLGEILEVFEKADYAFRCEVEIAFPRLLDELERSVPDFSSVPNLIWRDGEEVKCNAVEIVEDINTIPFPAWDLMVPGEYPEAPHGAFFKSFPTAPIIITRGCPFQCTFCSGKSVTTKFIRKRSVDNVVEEMDLLKRNYGVNDFLIEDENFTLHRQLLLEFCDRLLTRDMRINWSCPSGVRLDTLDAEMLNIMEKSGCYSLSVGVEFGSQRIHELTKKNLTLDTIREKINLFKGTKIKTTGFFLMGIPGETKEEMIETIRFAKSLPLDRAQFNNFMPLPGSKIYKDLKSNSGVEINFDHFFVHDVSYVPEGMTRKEMKNLQRRAYLAFYLRPSVVFNIIKEITSPSQFYRLMKRFMDAMK